MSKLQNSSFSETTAQWEKAPILLTNSRYWTKSREIHNRALILPLDHDKRATFRFRDNLRLLATVKPVHKN